MEFEWLVSAVHTFLDVMVFLSILSIPICVFLFMQSKTDEDRRDNAGMFLQSTGAMVFWIFLHSAFS